MPALKSLLRAAVLAATVALPAAARADTYTFVGSWNVSDGPYWGDNPQVMSGRQTAAFLFGGSAGDYAISTKGSDASMIDFKAILDGWGDHSATAFDQDFATTTRQDGGYNCGRTGCSYSAYVSDGISATNYAFRVTASDVTTTPEPASVAMLAIGGLGLAGTVRARRRNG